MSENKEKILLSRRAALGALGATVALSSAPFSIAHGQDLPAPKNTEEYLIKGGYVLTIDDQIGDFEVGDVHIKAGKIEAVGAGIQAAGATIVDASDCIVLPGFVDTHYHMWISIWRGMVNDAPEYFGARTLAEAYTPEDHYQAIRYAALEALNAGYTTCHNWGHGVRNLADAEAEMRALADTGIRAKMGYPGVTASGSTSETDLRSLLAWIEQNGQGRLGLGIVLDGARQAFPEQVALARSLGLRPISDHGGFMAFPDLIGPEFIYTHGPGIMPEAIALLISKQANFGLCPSTDPMIGIGLPPIGELLDGGVPLDKISVTIDVTAQTPVDPFAMLRTLVNAGRIRQANSTSLTGVAQSDIDWKLSYRDALRIGTFGGANVLGLADSIGSLKPGKQADVIMVRTDQLNMLPAENANPTFQLVQHALPSNVDSVWVGGRLLKHRGALVGIDVRDVTKTAAAAQKAIRERASFPRLDLRL